MATNTPTPARSPQRRGDRSRTALPDPRGELLVRVAAGDRAAFDHLYDALAPQVLGLTRRVLRNHALAEEVTQDVMIELWRTAPRYDPARGSVSSWMLTIAHRRAIDRVRAESAARRRERTLTNQSALIDYDTVTDTAARHDEIRQLRACLSCLTPLQRETLHLAYYDGHTCPEIADLLGISLPAVKARIRAALQRLRDHTVSEDNRPTATELPHSCRPTVPPQVTGQPGIDPTMGGESFPAKPAGGSPT